MDVKHAVFTILTTIAFAILLTYAAIDEAQAKGGGGARGGSVSSARSYSAPARPSYTNKTTATRKPASKYSSWFNRKDDDVECDTLRNSRYMTDREVYKRYC